MFWEHKCKVLDCDQIAPVITNKSTYFLSWHCHCCDELVVRGGKSNAVYRSRDAERGRETDFADKLIYASVAYIYDCDGLGSLNATVQSKSCYVQIIKI
jgi:hypothetical protein